MTVRFRTSIEYLSIVDGIPQDEPTNLGIFERGATVPQRNRRGNLYVIVETIGGFTDAERIERQIVRTAQERFEHTTGSITAGIREAIKAANEFLYEQNVAAPREERGVAGLTCMVLRGKDAYVGQLGPALLYHIGQEQAERFPADSSWLSSAELQDVDVEQHPPLGLRQDVEPILYHRYLHQHDVFILATTALAQAADDEDIADLAAGRASSTVRQNLEALAEGHDLTAIVIQIEQSEAEPEPAPETDRVDEAVLSDQRGPSLLERMRSFFPPNREQAPEEYAYEPEEYAYQPEEEEEERFPWLHAVGRVATSAGTGLTKAMRGGQEMIKRMLPDAETKRRAGAAHPRRATKTATTGMDRRWMWLAVMIPVLVVVLVFSTKMQQERSRRAALDGLLEQAATALTSAESNANSAEPRTLLANALDHLAEAKELAPEDSRISSQQQAVEDALDRVNRVTRIAFRALAEMSAGEMDPDQASTIVVHERDLYVLDGGTDQVYHYRLNETGDGLQESTESPVILAKGDQYGGTTVGELLDMVWADEGQERTVGGLVIIDKLGQELGYEPGNGITLLPMMDNSGWRDPVAATTFYENLYLLDPQGSTILKYLPSARGYDMPPGAYFTENAQPNITSAVDLAIDGHVYILHSDGGVTKYLTGKQAEFALDTLDVTANDARGLVVTGPMQTEGEPEGSLYIVDSGNQRILRYSKDGKFQQQLHSNDPALLAQPRSIFVDEEAKRLYVVDGNRLLVGALP